MLFWHVSEPCHAFQRKRTFRISGGERESLRMSARLCAWLCLSVPLVVRSALLSGPHPSQMMTRGPGGREVGGTIARALPDKRALRTTEGTDRRSQAQRRADMRRLSRSPLLILKVRFL